MQKRDTSEDDAEPRKRVQAATVASLRMSDVSADMRRLIDAVDALRGSLDRAAAAEGELISDAMLRYVSNIDADTNVLANLVMVRCMSVEHESKRVADEVDPPRRWFEGEMPEFMRVAAERYEAEKRAAAAEEERKLESRRRESEYYERKRMFEARGRVKAGVASEYEKMLVLSADGALFTPGAEKSSGDK